MQRPMIVSSYAALQSNDAGACQRMGEQHQADTSRHKPTQLRDGSLCVVTLLVCGSLECPFVNAIVISAAFVFLSCFSLL